MHPDFQKQYDRWVSLVGDVDPYEARQRVGIKTVLRAHFLIADFFHNQNDPMALIGPRDDLSLLHSALSRQNVSFGGADKWSQPSEYIATLFYGLCKNHAFHDGNKRTALLTALYHISLCDREPTFGQKEFERLTVDVADSALHKYPRFNAYVRKNRADTDVTFLAHWFRCNTRAVDNRQHTITYNDLRRILQRHGYDMENLRDNHIDIVGNREVSSLLGLRKNIKRVRVCQIGMPSWTTQVGRGAINTVRKETGLTPENGYDSAVFYEGVDHVSTLIDMYSGPLKRLKDK